MPKTGMPNSTNASLRRRAATFCTNVAEVFPRPFKILPVVVDKYKKGQSQARILIKFPELESWNTVRPNWEP